MLLSQTEPQDKAVSHHRNESLVLPSTRQSAPVSPPGLVVWAVRTVAADYVRLCACVCFDRPSRMAARDRKWPKAPPNVSFSSRDFLPELFVCFLWRTRPGSDPPGFV